MNQQFPPGLMSVPEFCAWANLGKTKVYELIKAKELIPADVGRRTLIPYIEAERWLASRMRAPH